MAEQQTTYQRQVLQTITEQSEQQNKTLLEQTDKQQHTLLNTLVDTFKQHSDKQQQEHQLSQRMLTDTLREQNNSQQQVAQLSQKVYMPQFDKHQEQLRLEHQLSQQTQHDTAMTQQQQLGDKYSMIQYAVVRFNKTDTDIDREYTHKPVKADWHFNGATGSKTRYNVQNPWRYKTPTRPYSDIISTLHNASHVDQSSQLLYSPELSRTQFSENHAASSFPLPNIFVDNLIDLRPVTDDQNFIQPTPSVVTATSVPVTATLSSSSTLLSPMTTIMQQSSLTVPKRRNRSLNNGKQQ